jgi:hypothetical protein
MAGLDPAIQVVFFEVFALFRSSRRRRLRWDGRVNPRIESGDGHDGKCDDNTSPAALGVTP